MAGLTPRDQTKWDNLQNQAGAAIDNILAGKGSDRDFKELSKILNEQHQLAGQIFDQGVTDAETTAATIVDAMNSRRIAEGKRPLTQKAFDRIFTSTLQQVMGQAIEDILGQVHDEFENQDEEIRRSLDAAMERIRNFTAHPQNQNQPQATPQQQANERRMSRRRPTDQLPEQNQEPAPRSLLDRFLQQPVGPQGSQGGRRSLLDRVLGRNRQAQEGQRTSLLTAIREAATSAKDKVKAVYNKMRGNGEEDEDKKASIWTRKLKAIFDPFSKAYGKVKKAGSKIGNILGMIGKPLLLALMNPQLIKSITDAVSEYLNFDSISKFISNTWESTKKLGVESIDWVIDKVKGFFGFGKDKKEEEAKARAAAAAPAKPRIDPLKLNVRTGDLPKSISPSMAASELPRREAQLQAAQTNLTAAKAAYAKNPTAANNKAVADAQNTVNLLTMKVSQFKQRADETKTAGSDPSSATSFVSAVPGTQAQNIEAQRGATAPNTTSSAPVADVPSVMTSTTSVAPPKTTVVADTPKWVPGKAYEPPMEKEGLDVSAAEPKAATSQIGMGSFGFDSNDSALNILNLGMVA